MDNLKEIELKLQKGRVRSQVIGKKFAILRTSKVKNLGNMAASLSHTFRERHTPNADLERTPSNTILIGPDTSDAVLQKWTAAAPAKQRKNAVLAVEYLVTGSPKAMAALSVEEQDQYFKDALFWLQTRHGPENVLSAVIHRDETTPHLTAMVIPLVEGKLNAKHFLGGRGKLTAMQTEFARKIGAEYGLERGLERSTATHQRVSQHYAAIQDGPQDAVSLPERHQGNILGVGRESDQDWHHRASEAASEALWAQRMATLEAQARAETAERATNQEKFQTRKAQQQTSGREQGIKNLMQALETERLRVQKLERIAHQRQQDIESKDARIGLLSDAIREAGVVDNVNNVFDGRKQKEHEQEAVRQQQLEQEQAKAAEQQAQAARQQERTSSLDSLKGTINMIRAHKTAVFETKGHELEFLTGFKSLFGHQGIERMANGDLEVVAELAKTESDRRIIAHTVLRLFKRNPNLGIDPRTIEQGMATHDPASHDLGGHSI